MARRVAAIAGLCLATGAWAQEYTILDLGTLGGTTSHADKISDSEHIAGWAQSQSTALAVVWEGGAIHQLGTLGQGSWAWEAAHNLCHNQFLVFSDATRSDILDLPHDFFKSLAGFK